MVKQMRLGEKRLEMSEHRRMAKGKKYYGGEGVGVLDPFIGHMPATSIGSFANIY